MVLVTRPQPGAADTQARLTTLGWRPLLAPMLTIETLATRLPAATAIQAVLVTSANALVGLPPSLRGVSLLAVGAASAARAQAEGFERIDSADGDAADLAVLAAARCDPAGLPLLLAQGQGRGDALAADLRAAGFRVIRATVYAARPAALVPAPVLEAWQIGAIGAALFFSAETARVFVRLIRRQASEGAAVVTAIAIGQAAAAALAPLPWQRVRVADRPDQEAMLALLS